MAGTLHKHTADDKLDENNFNWLGRAYRGSTYTSYVQFSHLPYCSFDWGENGYAGSCNYGGELLYLSARSKYEGLIMARGHFATSLYASMSRSQIEFGGPSTFGLEVSRCKYTYDRNGDVLTEEGKKQKEKAANQSASGAKEVIQEGKLVENESTNRNVEGASKTTPEGEAREGGSAHKDVLVAKNGSTFSLGSMIDRGSFNYRWPVVEYYLDLHPNQVVIDSEKLERLTKAEEATQPTFQQDAQQGPQQGIQQGPQAGGRQSVQQGAHHTISGVHDAGETAGTGKNDVQKEPQEKQKERQQVEEKPPQNSPPVKHVGTCQMFSCAKDNLFYQVLRIEEGGQFDVCFPADSQIVLTMGGPVWFQSFNDGEHKLEGARGFTTRGSSHQSRKKSQVAADDDKQHEEVEDASVAIGESTETIRYWDKAKGGRGLEAKVYQLKQAGNYELLRLIKSTTEADNGPRYVAGTTKLTAYNALGELETAVLHAVDQPKPPRSATFLAVIRLFEGDMKRPDWRPLPWELPTSKQFYDHIGVNPSSFKATGDMWERIFLDRRKEPEPILNLSEFNMIGRSLEKILQIDYVPEEDEKPDRKEYGPLVSNRFVKGNIDLKALFWKIRFLLRTHKFLSHIRGPDDPSTQKNVEEPEPSNPIPDDLSARVKGKVPESHVRTANGPSTEGQKKEAESIEEEQMNRIQTKVESVVRYLAKVLLEPPLGKPKMMPDNHIQGESNYYYVMMTVWFVWKYSKEYLKDHPGREAWNFDWTIHLAEIAKLKKKNRPVLLQLERLPPDHWTFSKVDRAKAQLLQWYHYGSLLKLREEELLPASLHGGDLEVLKEKVSRLAKAAKMASSAKLSSGEPYKADDEIFDRLSFVSDELGLEGAKPNRLGIIESLAMARVKERDLTRSFSPGWLPQGEEESISGPWEIHALCHHSRLVVLIKEEKSKQDSMTEEHTKTETETFRHKICTFLNAEGTLVPCWERAHAKAKRGWLRSEATAVVASTLLIILEKKTQRGHGSADSSDIGGGTSSKQTQTEDKESPPSPSEQSLTIISNLVRNHNDQIGQDERRLLLEVQHLEGLMKGQLDAFERFTNEAGLLPPIQWESFRPARKYHPVNFFNSLEDTPELYKAKEIGKTSIPLSLCNLISSPGELRDARKDFTKQDIDDVLSMECLVLFDIKAIENDDDEDGFTWKPKKYKYDKSTPETIKETKETFLWALYDNLVDQEVQHRFLTVIPKRDWDEKLQKNADDDSDEINDKNLVKNSEQNPRKKSDNTPGEKPGNELDKGSEQDSKKDLDNNAVKKVKKPSPIPRKVLELLVYVIHPESAACLGDHVLNLSRFSCQIGETWVASITLRSWRVDRDLPPPPPPKEKKKRQRKKKKDGDDNKNDISSEISPEDCHDFRLPSNLQPVWVKKYKDGVGKALIFRPEVSSIVLSTNSFGDFSKCTVVSNLFPEDTRDKEMERLVDDSRKLWQKFIHQPQTARCLVFFLVLGELCKEITYHYEKAITTLSSILNLDSTFATSEDEYPLDFELGVWSLDALYKLQNSLNATVHSLLKAKEELTVQIKDGPGKRNVKLERMCHEYLGAFENNLDQLTAVNIKLDRRIELNTRNKDATSAVLTMRDSRTAISQNSTIQKLTYLTIGYLPMALMSAIFAIPLELNVLYIDMENHGRSWFVGGIFILAVATYALAIFIGSVLDFFRYPPPQPGGVGKKVRRDNPPNIWKWVHLPEFLELFRQFFGTIFHGVAYSVQAAPKLLPQSSENNADPDSPQEKPEARALTTDNELSLQEKGEAKKSLMEESTKSVPNGNDTPNSI